MTIAEERRKAKDHKRYLVKRYGKKEGERLATLSPEEFKVIANARKREIALVKMNTPEVVAKLKAAHTNRSDEDEALRSKRLSVALLEHYEDPAACEVTRQSALKWHREETPEQRAARGRKASAAQKGFSKEKRKQIAKNQSKAQKKRFASMTEEEREVHKRKQSLGWTEEVRAQMSLNMIKAAGNRSPKKEALRRRRISRAQQNFSHEEKVEIGRKKSEGLRNRPPKVKAEHYEKIREALNRPEALEAGRIRQTKLWEAGVFDNVDFFPHGGTWYKDVKFRASWSAWFAKELDKLNIRWEYEKHRLPTSLGNYTPDFYLPDSDEYIEIKADYWETDEQKAKIEELRSKGHIIYYLVNEQIGAWLHKEASE